MRLDQLNYFVRVAEIGSITKAAENLYTSKHVVSKAIKQMEVELGVKLLYRKRNKITLTNAGMKTVGNALEVLALYNDLLSTLESYREPVSHMPFDELDIFSIPILAETILPVNIRFCRDIIAKGLAIGFTDKLVDKYFENKYLVPIPFEEEFTCSFCIVTTAEMSKKITVKEFLRALKKMVHPV